MVALLVAARGSLARGARGRRHAALDRGAEADRLRAATLAISRLVRRHVSRLWPSSYSGEDRLRFDVAVLQPLPPAKDGRTRPPRQRRPRGCRLDMTAPLFPLTTSPLPLRTQRDHPQLWRSHPDGGRFLLGTDWYLRAFDRAGTAIWQRPVPGPVQAVNVSGDGRLAVAVYGDGDAPLAQDGGRRRAAGAVPATGQVELGRLDARGRLCRQPRRHGHFCTGTSTTGGTPPARRLRPRRFPRPIGPT